MYNYTKILLLSAILALPCATFANPAVTDVYCPQIITCTNQICTPLPPKFEQWNTPSLPNGKYYFWQASVQTGPQQICDYRDDPHPNMPQIEFRATRYHADVYVSNEWNLYNTIYWCTTTNPLECPFYIE